MLKYLFTFLILIVPVSEILSQDHNAEVKEYSTQIVIDNNYKLIKFVSVTIQINNRAGEDLTEIAVPYSNNNPVSNIEAHIEKMNGNIIRKLKKKDIIEKSDISRFSLYEDYYVKTFTLKHNVYPYKIKYSYEISKESFFSIIKWTPVRDREYPTRNAKITIEIPEDYKIKVDRLNIDKAVITYQSGIKKYRWISDYEGNFKKEIYSPLFVELNPSLSVIPVKFKYSSEGSSKDWKSFGNWVFDLNEGLDDLPDYEKNKIDELLKGVTKDKEKIKILYKYLQENTRYVNVTIDEGGYKPYPASYVCKNKFGDCKALTNYMMSILNYSGIKSNYSLIYANKNFKRINIDFPSSQFNHAVLFIPLKNDTIWLECTSDYNPAGYLGTFTQGRYALVTDKDKSKLIKTPEMKLTDTEEFRTIRFKLSNNETTPLTINLHAKGNKYETFSAFDQLNKNRQDKYIYKLIPLKNFELSTWSLSKPDKEKASVCLNAELTIKNYVKSFDNLKYLSLFPTNFPDFERPEKRVHDVRINYPINIKDSLIYEKIEGFEFQALNDTSIHSKYGSFIIKSKIEQEKLTVIKQFVIYSGLYSKNEYISFYGFMQSVKNTERKNPIVLSKK